MRKSKSSIGWRALFCLSTHIADAPTPKHDRLNHRCGLWFLPRIGPISSSFHVCLRYLPSASAFRFLIHIFMLILISCISFLGSLSWQLLHGSLSLLLDAFALIILWMLPYYRRGRLDFASLKSGGNRTIYRQKNFGKGLSIHTSKPIQS